MKNLKKLFLMSLILFMFLINNSSVKAFNVGDKYTFNWNGDAASSLGIKGGNWPYHVWNYYATANSKQVKLYCVDPVDLNNARNSTVKVKQIFDFGNAGTSLETRALYYGLYTILENGAKSTTSNTSDITATDLAVRAYFNEIMGLDDKNYESGDVSRVQAKYAVMNLGYGMAINNKDKISALGVSIKKPSKNYAITGGKSTVTKAKNLIQKGIDAAYEFFNKGGIDDDTEVNVTSNSVKIDRNTEEKIVNFKITKNKDGYVKVGRSDIVCNNCAENGITIEKVEYQENGEWKELGERIDISNFADEDGNVKIKITIHKEMTESETCGNITVNYLVPETKDISIALFDDQISEGTQRYVGVIPNDYVTSESNKQDKTLQYIMPIECLGVACDTTLTTPICSEEDDGVGSVIAPEDIKKCIIENVDDAGNTYKLDESLGGISNDYCDTFCKEDYREIVLNKAIDKLNCGGYFKLKAKVTGSMDCYRGKGTTKGKQIDVDKYLEDIIEIQTNFIDMYDLYTKAKVAQGNTIQEHKKKIQDIDEETGTIIGYHEETDYWYVEGNYAGRKVGTTNKKTGEVTDEGETHKFKYTGENESDVTSQIENDLSKASEALEKLQTRYENTIENFNSCSTEWESEFKFEDKIAWEYDIEEYMKLVSDDAKYLEMISGTTRPEGTLMACEEDVDNKYEECSSGWTSPESLLEKRSHTICSTEGCKKDEKDVSKAKFAKQKFEETTQEYLTPTVFYQIVSSGPMSGHVTNQNYSGPNLQVVPVGEPDGSGHGLPLSSDANGGGIFKLKIEDLGEFYDTGDLGRLIDFGGENEQRSVANAKGVNGTDTWNGEYVCHYYTTCIPDDNMCPQCDFVCEGEYCEWVPCPTCDIECVNCIFNLDKLQLNFKSVTTSGGFTESAGREYGYNWNVNTTLSELSLVRDKAEETIKEIEESNTTIYNDDKDDPDSKLEFSIQLSSDMIQHIRDYNKEQVGGYGNNTLTCYDYEAPNNAVYKDVFCYSSFIDDLVNNYGDKVYIKNRGAGDSGSRTPESVVNSGYWTPWDGYTYNESIVGGPAWK